MAGSEDKSKSRINMGRTNDSPLQDKRGPHIISLPLEGWLSLPVCGMVKGLRVGHTPAKFSTHSWQSPSHCRRRAVHAVKPSVISMPNSMNPLNKPWSFSSK